MSNTTSAINRKTNNCRKFFIVILLVVCCGQVNGMESQRQPIGKNSFKTVAVIVTLPFQWVYGCLKQHPVGMISTALTMGALVGGGNFFWKMTGKSHSALDKHKQHLKEEIDADNQVNQEVKGVLDTSGQLQKNINSKFGNLDDKTKQSGGTLTEFGGVLGKSLDQLDAKAQRLATEEDLLSSRRKMSSLDTIIAQITENASKSN